jgi:glutamyl-tRNA reductase
MINLPLRHIFHSAIRTGRRVRSETAISKNSLSTSSVAVDMATAVIGDLKKCKMLVIGAGEAGRLVVKVARERGASQIVIASRTKERAQSLSTNLHGTPISLDNMANELKNTNLIVTCAGAPHKILDVNRIKEVMAQRPDFPMVIIDIAVPRNVEPEAGQIKNVFLYNIDDLTKLSDSNRSQRENEIQNAKHIIGDELDRFMIWWQEFKIRPVIRAMVSKAEKIRSSQFDRTIRKIPQLSEEEYYNLEMMTKSIVNKILKDPIKSLKDNGEADSIHIETIRQLFHLNTKDVQ